MEINDAGELCRRIIKSFFFRPPETPVSSFLKFTGIAQPGSVKKALQRLVDLKILYTVKNEYKFANPYFKAWLIAENI